MKYKSYIEIAVEICAAENISAHMFPYVLALLQVRNLGNLYNGVSGRSICSSLITLVGRENHPKRNVMKKALVQKSKAFYGPLKGDRGKFGRLYKLSRRFSRGMNN